MSPEDSSVPPPGPVPPDDRPPSQAERQPAPFVPEPIAAAIPTAGAPRRSAAWGMVRGILVIPVAFVAQGLGAVVGHAIAGSDAGFMLPAALGSLAAILVLLAWWSLVVRQPWSALGLASGARRIAGGLVGGFGLGVIVLGVVAGAGCLLRAWTIEAQGTVSWLAIAGWTIVLVPAAFFEELLLRGHVAQELGRWKLGIGLVASSALFAVVHLGNPNAFASGRIAVALLVANIVLAGLLLCAAFLQSQDLWFPTGLHFGWNWALAVLFGLPVSGFALPSIFKGTMATPAAPWTGSAFGPESSAIALVVLGAVAMPWLATLLRRGVTTPALLEPATPATSPPSIAPPLPPPPAEPVSDSPAAALPSPHSEDPPA